MQGGSQSDRGQGRTDALTGLATERVLDETVMNALAKAFADARPLCVLICRINQFEAFKDTWGRPSGDQVLRLIANCIRSIVKEQDTAARFGEQEFAIILPDTGIAGAMMVAGQIERSVKSRKLVRRHSGESLGFVTLSVGACERTPGDTSITLLARAQHALGALSPDSTTMPTCERLEPVEPQSAARI